MPREEEPRSPVLLESGDAWGALSQAQTPSFDEAALWVMARLFGSPILQAVRHEDFHGVTPATSVQGALHRTFALNATPHAFDAMPHSWTTFREPQITTGLAYFLGSGPQRGRPRVQAFLNSAFRTSGAVALTERLGASEVGGTLAKAEEARVDLVVEAALSDGTRTGVVVEAKFCHHLTRGQLPAATRHAVSRGLTAKNAAFLVVLPDIAMVGTAIFSKVGNRHWRAVSWWDLLLDFERTLDPSADDGQFRAFRRTIWSQSYE
jgi:hypothetical protein